MLHMQEKNLAESQYCTGEASNQSQDVTSRSDKKFSCRQKMVE